MKLKAFAVCLLLCVVSVTAVAAQTSVFEDPVFESGGTVVLNAHLDEGQDITLKVFKQSENVSDDDVVAVLQKICDESGKAKFTFSIPAEKNGKSTNGTYIVEYNVAGGEKQQALTFKYVSFEFLLEKIREAETADEIVGLFDASSQANRDALEVMGFDMSGYDSLSGSEQKAAAELFLQLADLDDGSMAQLSLAYSEAVGIKLINKEKISEGLSLYNPEADGIYYNSTDETFKTWVVSAMKKLIPVDERTVDAAYEQCANVYEITNALSSGVGTIIAKKHSTFGLDDSSRWNTYYSADSIKKGYVHDKMTALFNSSNYTYADVLSVFENAVDDVLKTSGGGSSGGSGGSGSKTTGSLTVAPGSLMTEHFSDISGYDWAKEAIETLSEKEILSGYGNRQFLPEKNMTREEFVKVLVLAAGIYSENAECNFTDVTKDKWYYSYVASAVEGGLINGISEDSFGVGLFVTRQDMAEMICRAADKRGITLKDSGAEAEFTDSEKIADYAIYSVKKLYAAGIISGMGDGSFAPTACLTRAQAAKVVYECFYKK